jgi:hypothetical protein
MESYNPPAFITLDVDIVSEEDLTLLADYFEEPAFVLGYQSVDNLYYLSLEPCWFREEENTPENCAKFFVEEIAKFPNELKDLWNNAKSKTFNFGFESGNVQPYYKSEISQDTLAKVAMVGASFIITIYQIPETEEECVQIQEGN